MQKPGISEVGPHFRNMRKLIQIETFCMSKQVFSHPRSPLRPHHHRPLSISSCLLSFLIPSDWGVSPIAYFCCRPVCLESCMHSSTRFVVMAAKTTWSPNFQHIFSPETHLRNEMFLTKIKNKSTNIFWRWYRQGNPSSNKYSGVVQQPQYWACIKLRGARKSNK